MQCDADNIWAQETISSPLPTLANPADFRAQVEGLRPYLLRYASLQLRNPESAEGALAQKQFLAALEECLRGLPERAAQAFMMRENLGLETREICKELAVTPTHLWVMLYWARMALRQCLEDELKAGSYFAGTASVKR